MQAVNAIAGVGDVGPWRRALSGAAMAGGALLLALAGTLWWQQRGAEPAYRYVMGETVPTAELGALATRDGAPPVVRRVQVVAPGDAAPLADLKVLESPRGPVLLEWQARIDDPFLTLDTPVADVAALSAVLARHVPKDATVFAWWDHARLFQQLAGVNVAFERHLGLPLFVPDAWRGKRAGVEAAEHAFWRPAGRADDAALLDEKARFERFTSALLAPEAQGIAGLQALAAGKRAVLVLHLRDLILLGQMAPRKLGVAFQDFGAMGDVHGMVRRVHAWLDENKYPTYGVLSAPQRPLRALALTDEASGRTLAARLLPLMGNEQKDVAGATLVYRVGGYSVFEIAPLDGATGAAAAATVPAAAQPPAPGADAGSPR